MLQPAASITVNEEEGSDCNGEDDGEENDDVDIAARAAAGTVPKRGLTTVADAAGDDVREGDRCTIESRWQQWCSGTRRFCHPKGRADGPHDQRTARCVSSER